MTALFRGMDRAQLDAAYNNRNAVPNAPDILAEYRAASERLRAGQAAELDLAYGDRPREKLDFYRAGPAGAPTLAFIHGGYWQMNAKDTFANVAAGPLANGINVAMIGYTLGPEARMDEISAEIRRSARWLGANLGRLGADPTRLVYSGWSAGGHLTAMVMDMPEVKGGLAISGLFDLEPIRLCYLNDALHMDEAEARRNSPQFHLPERAGPLVVTVGGRELPELQRQSADYWAAWSAKGLPGYWQPMPDDDHFTIVAELAKPDGKLTRIVKELVGA